MSQMKKVNGIKDCSKCTSINIVSTHENIIEQEDKKQLSRIMKIKIINERIATF